MKMEKIDQLFIRACKSFTPSKRVESVYRRFYAIEPRSVNICIVLTRICDKYLNIRLADLIECLNPENAWKYGNNLKDDYYGIVVNVLVSKIRFSEVETFNGLSTPRMFRKFIKGKVEK